MVSFIVEFLGASGPKRAAAANGSWMSREYPMTNNPATMRRGAIRAARILPGLLLVRYLFSVLTSSLTAASSRFSARIYCLKATFRLQNGALFITIYSVACQIGEILLAPL